MCLIIQSHKDSSTAGVDLTIECLYKSFKGPPRNYQQRSSGDNCSMRRASTQPVFTASTPDFHRPQPMAHYRSQSDTKGINPSTKEHPVTWSEPNNHSGGASGEWTEVKRKSNKSTNHPPSTQGMSNPKDR